MQLEIFPIKGIKEIEEGDDLAEVILSTISSSKNRANPKLKNHDILMVTQKIVSKSEGRIIQLKDRNQSTRLEIAKSESKRILRQRGDLIISETREGFVCANAGVDFSNLKEGSASLLPLDSDLSAGKILKKMEDKSGKKLAVIITDTFGRPWRRGLTNVAIGAAGIKPIIDLRGETDSFGQELHATEMAVADELAGASEMVMGKSESIPAAIIRGVPKEWFGAGSVKKDLLRNPDEDFFR